MFPKFKNEKGVIHLIVLLIAVIIIGIGAYFLLSSESPLSKKQETTDPTLIRIKQAGKIVVGTDATYPPMEYVNEDGQIVGLDADIAQAIATDLGVNMEFKQYPWENLFDSVKKDEVDMMISAITITPERAQELSFSDPYFNAGQVIVVLETNKNIIKPEDLAGEKVGVQKETTSIDETKKYVEEPLIIAYEDYSTATDDLKSKKVDAVVIDYSAGLSLVQSTNGLKLANDPFTQEFYGIAVKKSEDQQALLSKINESIRKLKDTGKIKELENKWLK